MHRAPRIDGENGGCAPSPPAIPRIIGVLVRGGSARPSDSRTLPRVLPKAGSGKTHTQPPAAASGGHSFLMYRYTLHYNEATVCLSSPIKLAYDALHATARELFPALPARVTVCADETGAVLANATAFNAYCLCKTSFAFTLRPARAPRDLVHEQLVSGDFTLRHVDAPIRDRLAGLSPFSALLNDIARRNWELRHVCPPTPRSPAITPAQPPRQVVEEALWARVRHGPSPLEVYFLSSVLEAACFSLAQSPLIRGAILAGTFRLRHVRVEPPSPRRSLLAEIETFPRSRLTPATSLALSTRSRARMLSSTPRSQALSKEVLHQIVHRDYRLRRVGQRVSPYTAVVREVARPHVLRHVRTRVLSPLERYHLLCTTPRSTAKPSCHRRLLVEIAQRAVRLNHVCPRVTNKPVIAEPLNWRTAIQSFDKESLRPVLTVEKIEPVVLAEPSPDPTRSDALPTPAAEAFAENLVRLAEMGFTDRPRNIKALLEAKNDIVGAVTGLLRGEAA